MKKLIQSVETGQVQLQNGMFGSRGQEFMPISAPLSMGVGKTQEGIAGRIQTSCLSARSMRNMRIIHSMAAARR